MNYGTFTLTCVHSKLKQNNVEILGIIRGGLCFTFSTIPPELPVYYPDANMLNNSKLVYKADQNFHKQCDELTLKPIHELKQMQHINLMDTLNKINPEYHKLPFHLWGTTPEKNNSLADSACKLLQHQYFIYYGEHILNDIHKYVDGVPILISLNLMILLTVLVV